MPIVETHGNFSEVVDDAQERILDPEQSELVETDTWQGKKSDKFSTWEYLNFSFTCLIPDSVEELQKQIQPNLPWANIAFKERIGREPTNPGYAYKSWPYYKDERGMREVEGGPEPRFSHTYQERYWYPARPGLTYACGNLDNVIELLSRDPFTRQAYLPIFTPEDTGAGATSIGYVPRRIPCSLGYGFLCRNSKLHIFYDIRSCDLLRHFL